MAHQESSHDINLYYVPHGSPWPILATLGLFLTMLGAAFTVNHAAGGGWMLLTGVAAMAVILFGWFGDVIRESIKGFYNSQVDVSFRMGRIWFIFSLCLIATLMLSAMVCV